MAVLAAVAATGFTFSGLPTTAALLTDSITAARVSVTAGSVNTPTGLTLSDTGSAVRVAWTSPPTGIAPQSYEVFARSSAGSYAGTPTATSASSPSDDLTPTDCSTWFYKVRSSHTNLKSAFTPETSLTIDRTAPTVSAARVVFTGGPTPVADYVRTSGGSTEVYANVTDNCVAASALTVGFDLSAFGAGTVAATFGSWTPVSGGPTYNYRAAFTLANAAVANAAIKTWSVTAADTKGNPRTVAGTAVTGDGAGPVYSRAEMVSAYTNFYDATLGNGEIPSDAITRPSGSYVYADFTDAGSGVGTITANLSAGGILTGATTLALTPGSYTTYAGGITWGWRSAATVVNTGLADGNRSFTVTGTDKVGNTPVSSGNQTVEIDDTAISSGSCTNAGNANNFLGSGDSTDFALNDTVFPDSIKPGWTGSIQTATAVLRNGTSDYFNLNTDFGLTMFQGPAYNQLWNLAANWVAANTNYAGSTLTLFSRTTVRLTYAGGSVPDLASTAQATYGTTLRDAAGTPVSAGFSVTCTTTPW